MNEEKSDIKEPIAIVEQTVENKSETDNKMLSIYTKMMLRLSLVGMGVMIFALAFLKATQITGFNATKLLLLEACLFIMFVFVIGISVALAKMRHECKAKNIFAVLIYVAALSVMVSLLLAWAFFKATSV